MKNFDPAGYTLVPISEEVMGQAIDSLPDGVMLVGGQALAFWVGRYGIDPKPKADRDRPSVSYDADFLGRREDVAAIAKKTSGKVRYPGERDLTILCGEIFVVDHKNKTYMGLDVIRTVGNMDTEAVRKHAVEAQWNNGKRILVMHPLDVLVNRAENFRKIREKQNDEGLRQVSLSVEVAMEYIVETAKRDEKVAMNAVDAVAKVARSPAGKYARKHGVEIYDAIQPETLRRLIKNKAFLEKRLPRLEGEISEALNPPGSPHKERPRTN